MKRYQFQIILAGAVSAEKNDIVEEIKLAQDAVNQVVIDSLYNKGRNVEITSTSASVVLQPESPYAGLMMPPLPTESPNEPSS